MLITPNTIKSLRREVTFADGSKTDPNIYAGIRIFTDDDVSKKIEGKQAKKEAFDKKIALNEADMRFYKAEIELEKIKFTAAKAKRLEAEADLEEAEAEFKKSVARLKERRAKAAAEKDYSLKC